MCELCLSVFPGKTTRNLVWVKRSGVARPMYGELKTGEGFQGDSLKEGRKVGWKKWSYRNQDKSSTLM